MGTKVALRKQPRLPAIHLVQGALFAVVICAGVMLLIEACFHAATGQFAMATLNVAYATFIFWFYTGTALIEYPLSLRILSGMDAAHLSKMERGYTLGVRKWQALPIFRGSGYLRMLTNQSLLRLLLGDYEGAELPLTEVIAMARKRKYLNEKSSVNSAFGAVVLNNMACLQIRKDNLVEAEELATSALSLSRKGKTASAAAFPLVNLGWIRMKENRPAEAEELLKEADQLFEGKLPPGIMHKSVTYAHTNGQIMLANALYQQDKLDEANAVCDGVIAALAEDESRIAITSVILLTDLADRLMSRQDFARAEHLLEHAYELVRQFPVHPDSLPLLLSYTQLLCLTDRQSELEDLKSWVRPVLLKAP